MKRFHVHVAVPDLSAGIRFYSTLFGAEPSVSKTDYAKWMLDDPRLNFAISERSATAGINHLGFQVDSGEELESLHRQLQAASREVTAEVGAHCCYAKSDKYWVTDPAGIAWESFHSLGSIPMFGDETPAAESAAAAGIPVADAPAAATKECCAPATVSVSAPCCGAAASATITAPLPKTTRAGCCS